MSHRPDITPALREINADKLDRLPARGTTDDTGGES